MGMAKLLQGAPRIARHAYVLLAVMVGWVFFRAEDLGAALRYLGAMFGGARGNGWEVNAVLLLDSWTALVLVVGCLGSLPLLPWLLRRLAAPSLESDPTNPSGIPLAAHVLGMAGVCVLFSVCSALLASRTNNPFIYFRF
jgi:alginate O-acetyltransferase complex protein AlgI